MKDIAGKICRDWEVVHNYDFAYNGRLWLCWNPKKGDVKFITGHAQALHCCVVDMRPPVSFSSCVCL